MSIAIKLFEIATIAGTSLGTGCFLRPLIEGFGQTSGLCEQRSLSLIFSRIKENSTVHDVLICYTDLVTLPNLEHESEPADAFGSLANNGKVFAANGNAHSSRPVAQALPKHHFSATSTQDL
jgi:hypothetical protein